MGRAEDLYEQLVHEGEAGIEDMLARRQSEELFLDFKRSSDSGQGPRLSQTDRNNLGRAISGFGNSEGGVVVWGVDCSRDDTGADLARAAVPITDPQRFVGWLEGAVSGCTLPHHLGLRHHAIASPGATQGYVVSLIPQSDRAPHQTVNGLQYLMRVGSSFTPVPHGVLAGMFGRAPRASLLPRYGVRHFLPKDGTVHLMLDVLVANAGPGIGRDVFLSMNVSGPDGPSKVEVHPPNNHTWVRVIGVPGVHSQVVSETIRMPPESILSALVVLFELRPPFESGCSLEGLTGASGALPTRFELKASPDTIARAHRHALDMPGGHLSAREFVDLLFGIEIE